MKNLSLEAFSKSFLRFALLFGALMCCSSFLGADEFDNINEILDSGDRAGKQALGTGVKWAFAVALPIIGMVTGMVMGYTQQKKKAEQEQNTTKLYVVTIIAGIVGMAGFILIAMFFSAALFGDKSAIFDVIQTFWRESVGI